MTADVSPYVGSRLDAQRRNIRLSEVYLPHRNHQEQFMGNGFVQPFCDTPLDEEIVGENVYLNIINKRQTVCIYLYTISDHR